jgi:hypothetical protein
MSYKNPQLLWSVSELKARLEDPGLVLLDLRTRYAARSSCGFSLDHRTLDTG